MQGVRVQKITDSQPLAVGSQQELSEGSQELDVHIANHVVRQVVADVEMLNLSKLVHLLKDVLIEVLMCHTPPYSVSVLHCDNHTNPIHTRNHARMQPILRSS